MTLSVERRVANVCSLVLWALTGQLPGYRRIHAIIYSMSRKQKFPGTSSASKVVADCINQLAKARCAKQTDLGRVLGRSQSMFKLVVLDCNHGPWTTLMRWPSTLASLTPLPYLIKPEVSNEIIASQPPPIQKESCLPRTAIKARPKRYGYAES